MRVNMYAVVWECISDELGGALKHTQPAAVTRDGATVHYTLRGEPQPGRPRVALVHSLAMGRAVWDAVADQLAATAEVVSLDCRGHGESSKPPGPYRIEAFADDLADLLDHLGWDEVNVAGASMGGSVSLQFAQRYPDRLRTLGLIDTTAWYGEDAAERWEGRARQAEDRGLETLLGFQEARWFTDSFLAQNGPSVSLCRSLFLANDVAAFAATCRMLGAFDLRSGLPAVRAPTAVIVGEEDYATPVAMARELHQGIPGATLQIIPNVRHLTFVERPDIIADALVELLNRIPTLA